MAMVMSAFVPVVIGSLDEMLKDWRFRGGSAVRNEAKKLRKLLEELEPFLEDAENKQIQDKSVEGWLARLRQAVYGADQLLESCKIEAEAARQWNIPIIHYFGSFGNVKSVKRNIISLNQSMVDIVENRPSMLTRTDKRTCQLHSSSNCRHSMCCNNLDGADVELEMSSLIEKLVEEDRFPSPKNAEVDRQHPVLLLAICGMGGIGKTSIARKIFDDQRTKSAFSTCLWAHIPKGFTHTDVLLETVRAAGKDLKGSETRSELMRILAKIIKGKRIFLVLNGTTSLRKVHPSTENAKMHLSLIDTLLVLCISAEGSRVLMTARDEDGAVKLVQKESSFGERLVVQIHQIPQLTVEHGWMLLRKTACLEQSNIIEDAPQIEITTVKKCNGLPLAIKIMGGVLRRKSCTPQVWKSVSDSEALSFKDLPEGTEGLMGTICLSYQDALPHVKQCFLYLSLFPLDFAFEQHFITQLWISEGLLDTRHCHSSKAVDQQNNDSAIASKPNIRSSLQTSNGCSDFLSEEREDGHRNQSSEERREEHNNQSSQEIAEDQGSHPLTGAVDVHNSHSSEEGKDKYKICSLEETADKYFNELVERNFIQPRKDATGYMMHERVWSFAQFLTKGEVFDGDTKDMDGLPTNLRRVSFLNMGLTAIPGDIGRLKSLRTLLLSALVEEDLDAIFNNLVFLQVLDLSNTEIKSIPKTLGNLVHLRHLDISQTRIEELPKSIDHLRRLRFLSLRECEKLHILPVTIQKLPKLEYLNLRDTKIPKEPPGLQNLRHLTFLHGFVVDNKSSYGWPLEELEDMSNLTSLHVKIGKALDTSNEVLKNKANLRSLELSCTTGDSEALAPEGIERMFTQLHPQQCLQSLKIDGYYGSAFPEWLSFSALPNMQQLNLVNCKFCESLPQLCQLQNLKILSIVNLSKLQAINMQGSAGISSFPTLEELHVEDMQNLESWSAFEAGDLPLLQKFHIKRCPKLKLLPGGLEHCKTLASIQVRHAEHLEVVDSILALKELLVETAPSLAKLSNLLLLKVLTVVGCPNLKVIVGANSLRHIHIEDEELGHLPKWLEQHSSRIATLDIVSNAELLGTCERNKDNWHIVREIARVNAYLPGRLSLFSYTRSKDFFCKYQRKTSQTHEDPSSVLAGSVDKRSDNIPSSSRSSGGKSNTMPSRAHDTYGRSTSIQRYAGGKFIISVPAIIILILIFSIATSHRDPWEAFCWLSLYFITMCFLYFQFLM